MKILTGTLLLLLLLAFSAEARNTNEVWRFRKMQPCPATGQSKGRCHGWEVDHVVPLKCGGADRPHNMQWLTVRDHKIKTKREARWCRKTARPRR